MRYLRPPTPPAPGDIVITQEPNVVTPPAPPLVIRQQPARPTTPEPLVIREKPPAPPPQIGRKVITISGKRLPPPPRKVVIERLAPLPSKPQGIMIERWLPYTQTKRRVIFQRNQEKEPVVVKPRNVIIQWEGELEWILSFLIFFNLSLMWMRNFSFYDEHSYWSIKSMKQFWKFSKS